MDKTGDMKYLNMKTFLVVLVVILLNGCYLEQGRLHFEELGLNPIVVYKMEPLETAVYCLAEGDVPAGRDFDKMFRESKKAIESDPENVNWGELACLSISGEASKEQLKEAVNVFQLIIAINPKRPGVPRAFKRMIEQDIKDLENKEKLAAEVEEIKVKKVEAEESLRKEIADNRKIYKQELYNLEQEIGRLEIELVEKKKDIQNLELQIKKLKEVEMLIQSKP